MTSRDFAYWLQGYFEVSGTTQVGEKETAIIRNHLNMVFKHEIDPSHGDAAHQKSLSDIHKGLPSGTERMRLPALAVDPIGIGFGSQPDFEAKINC